MFLSTINGGISLPHRNCHLKDKVVSNTWVTKYVPLYKLSNYINSQHLKNLFEMDIWISFYGSLLAKVISISMPTYTFYCWDLLFTSSKCCVSWFHQMSTFGDNSLHSILQMPIQLKIASKLCLKNYSFFPSCRSSWKAQEVYLLLPRF